MSTSKIKNIKIAILAEEPLGWGSGKHYFPIILNDYSWIVGGVKYCFKTTFIYDKDIIRGKLNINNYDVLLIPGGGVGDGEAVVKGFKNFGNTKKWKKQIHNFTKNGGGIVGICGGAALITSLDMGPNKKPKTLTEKQYDKSSLKITKVKHYYKNLAFPLLYPFQRKHPEKIGATAYVFSFAPGETIDGKKIHTGGVPIDYIINKDNAILKDFPGDKIRIRWWGGPALTIPKDIEPDINVLAYYPEKVLSDESSTRIYAWKYVGGFIGIIKGFLKALSLRDNKKDKLSNIFLYTFYLAKPWKRTNRIIDLNLSNKPAITAEVFPNENKARIILCTAHPEYMIWWNGFIDEVKDDKNSCLANGFHKWKDIKPLSESLRDELTYTWWLVRRFTAWAAKVPDNDLPPIQKGEINEEARDIIKQNVFWDGSLINLMDNI
jgi:hypothetical protein